MKDMPSLGVMGAKPLPSLGGGAQPRASAAQPKPAFKDSDDEEGDWKPPPKAKLPAANATKKPLAFFDEDSD